jgi:cobalt-zinc-cadmium resistance protein CzcA
VLQIIDFPTVYTNQRQAQNKRIEIAATEKRITVNNLTYKVRSAYQHVQFLLAKNRLLEAQDSVYVDLVKVNEVRYRVGQISQLERINGESQYKRIQFSLKQTRSELRNAKYQFNLLIGYPNDTTHIPAEQFARLSEQIEETSVDTTHLTGNPILLLNRQNELLNKKMLQVERSKRIPGLIGGFLNQGTESTPWSSRIRVGITLPVWQWTYQGNINAAKKGIEIAQTQRQLQAFQLSTEYAKALADYRQYRDHLAYFETVGLREADEILRNAKESFRLGSINYYAFLQNLELSFSLRQNYLESVKNYNQAVLNLMYIRGDLLDTPRP